MTDSAKSVEITNDRKFPLDDGFGDFNNTRAQKNQIVFIKMSRLYDERITKSI